MRNGHRQVSRRLIQAILTAILVLVSGVFFASFQAGAGDPPETRPPQATAAEPGITEPDPPPEPPGQEQPQEPESPPGGTVIEHPLPEDPILTDGPWATEHFLMAEYACDCPGYCDGFPNAMDPVLLEHVEALRNALGRPVIITSGVRCPARNAEVGGIAGSWHLYGHAADLYCPGVPYDEVAAQARALGLGVIEYPGLAFDHVEIWR
ncbi:D-Ala-D-Ala carboxypeptidase family metallohydrolase [Eubacterium sp. 1001713B170207_170306_E7]|uniref:YcbK family protein n=1 Tax=Eubacterium sp. 1001713B170207_170306_E7 TaxID=2787097 RepID=UPI00189B35B0|nr:D-Ala-D-Ala carboxypeptidase family metallohydrolase [Eubacterium sp. 1001713B170207_170306_E7]